MLDEIPVPDSLAFEPPEKVSLDLIVEAEARIELFTRTHRPRIDNFVVCDFPLVDSALRWIVDQNLLCGDAFCEWGSGFGVVTLLAALHDLDASGIEVESVLVQQAEQLAEDMQIQAAFARGSFIPSDGEDLIDLLSEVEHVETDCPSSYDELDAEIADFDLFFAFPWPGEQGFFEEVFDRFAADGAMLLTYQGIEQLRLHRRVGT